MHRVINLRTSIPNGWSLSNPSQGLGNLCGIGGRKFIKANSNKRHQGIKAVRYGLWGQELSPQGFKPAGSPVPRRG